MVKCCLVFVLCCVELLVYAQEQEQVGYALLPDHSYQRGSCTLCSYSKQQAALVELDHQTYVENLDKKLIDHLSDSIEKGVGTESQLEWVPITYAPALEAFVQISSKVVISADMWRYVAGEVLVFPYKNSFKMSRFIPPLLILSGGGG